MSDPYASPAAWPAARPSGINPIQHPAWEEARNAILDLAAAGPVTAIIVGESGTGKSWLLRELASALGEHGFPTMMLLQGNLPMTLSNGAALLVDDASLMDEPTRAELSAQRHGVVILAGVEWFEDELDPASSTPVIVRLRTLLPNEIADFAGDWLQRSGLSDSMVGPGLLARLTSNSGGRVGTIVRLLGEAATGWQNFPILSLGEPKAEFLSIVPDPEPMHAPTVMAPVRHRRRIYGPVLGVSAIAAAIALGWALMPVPPPTKTAQTTTPSAVPADTTTPALPPLQSAELPQPTLAAAAVPARSHVSAPPLAASSVPEMEASTVPVETEIPSSLPVIAAFPPPDMLAPADPTLIATLDDPTVNDKLLPSVPFNRTGGPGLVLIAQRGDTLESLYGDVYRDRRAPPFAIVLAANPRPFRPGSIVVFPEPPGGWQRVQR